MTISNGITTSSVYYNWRLTIFYTLELFSKCIENVNIVPFEEECIFYRRFCPSVIASQGLY